MLSSGIMLVAIMCCILRVLSGLLVGLDLQKPEMKLNFIIELVVCTAVLAQWYFWCEILMCFGIFSISQVIWMFRSKYFRRDQNLDLCSSKGQEVCSPPLDCLIVVDSYVIQVLRAAFESLDAAALADVTRLSEGKQPPGNMNSLMESELCRYSSYLSSGIYVN
ncbi:hypothetical protein ACH5RR_032959 [Cinchona calisaya]|uniref:PIN-like protein n=1 Tax=Cinchona calisaya TaxID=153742 RepID=A0ABD2YMR7_9GENT